MGEKIKQQRLRMQGYGKNPLHLMDLRKQSSSEKTDSKLLLTFNLTDFLTRKFFGVNPLPNLEGMDRGGIFRISLLSNS